jgi:hypothetical protein
MRMAGNEKHWNGRILYRGASEYDTSETRIGWSKLGALRDLLSVRVSQSGSVWEQMTSEIYQRSHCTNIAQNKYLGFDSKYSVKQLEDFCRREK